MTTPPAPGARGRLHIGLVLIALGTILTLGQAGLFHLEGLFRFWPLLIIGIGLVKAGQPPEDGQRAIGVALLLVGGLLLLVGVLSWGRAWPLVFVLVGALLLGEAIRGGGAPLPEPFPSPYVSELVFMGGAKKRPRMAGFQGGYVTAVLGGVELDLRKVQMGKAPAVLDVVAIGGGVELKVPSGWSVDGRVLPLLGGFEDKTQPLVESTEAPRLIVRGYAIMGGVVIGN